MLVFYYNNPPSPFLSPSSLPPPIPLTLPDAIFLLPHRPLSPSRLRSPPPLPAPALSVLAAVDSVKSGSPVFGFGQIQILVSRIQPVRVGLPRVSRHRRHFLQAPSSSRPPIIVAEVKPVTLAFVAITIISRHHVAPTNRMGSEQLRSNSIRSRRIASCFMCTTGA